MAKCLSRTSPANRDFLKSFALIHIIISIYRLFSRERPYKYKCISYSNHKQDDLKEDALF